MHNNMITQYIHMVACFCQLTRFTRNSSKPLYPPPTIFKLEIWGRAQREAARRHKFDWGTAEGLKFRLQQSHVAWTQLHYHTCVASTMLNLDGSKSNNRTLLFVNPNSQIFLWSTWNRS